MSLEHTKDTDCLFPIILALLTLFTLNGSTVIAVLEDNLDMFKLIITKGIYYNRVFITSASNLLQMICSGTTHNEKLSVLALTYWSTEMGLLAFLKSSPSF